MYATHIPQNIKHVCESTHAGCIVIQQCHVTKSEFNFRACQASRIRTIGSQCLRIIFCNLVSDLVHSEICRFAFVFVPVLEAWNNCTVVLVKISSICKGCVVSWNYNTLLSRNCPSTQLMFIKFPNSRCFINSFSACIYTFICRGLKHTHGKEHHVILYLSNSMRHTQENCVQICFINMCWDTCQEHGFRWHTAHICMYANTTNRFGETFMSAIPYIKARHSVYTRPMH